MPIVLLKIFFLLDHHNVDDSIFNQISKKRLVVVQVFIDDGFDILFGEIDTQLWAVQISGGGQKFAEAAFERFGAQVLHHAFSRDVKGVFHVIQHEAIAVIKNRAAVVLAVAFDNGNIIEVPVFVGDQCIHLEKQREIFTEVAQARGGFHGVNDQRKSLLDRAFLGQNSLVICA